jgi:hypothetical protein
MDYSMASSPSISFACGAFSSEHYLVFSHCSIFSQRADWSMANLLVEHVFGLHGFKCSKSAVA